MRILCVCVCVCVCVCADILRKSGAACAAMRRYVDVAVIRNCLLRRGKYKGFF